MSRESKVFLSALGVIALHVADDSFIHPQPGTGVGDHLVSGLVPLALLLAAALAYPRLRAGTRAALALVMGAFGVTAALEALHYTLHADGPSGDDFTGLLCVPAGLVLLVLGAAILWRTRRLDERLPRRYARRLAAGLGSLVVTWFVVFGVAFAYVINHAGRPPVEHIDLGASARAVTLETEDDLKLKGSYVPSRNGAAVIAFPGRKGPQRHARMLVRHGYGVLVLDRRGEGESEGDPSALGWDGDKDLMAAIAFLKRQPDVDRDRVGGLGLSVGGELLLQTAARTDDLRAVVSEGAGVRSFGELLDKPGGDKWTQVPLMAVMSTANAVFSGSTPPAKLSELVAEIAPRAVFLIHATHGMGGEEQNAEYERAAGEPTTRWEIPEATHTGGLTARPREYERRVVGFFDRELR